MNVEIQAQTPRHRWPALLAPLVLAVLLSGLLAYTLLAAPLGERVRLDTSSMQAYRPNLAASADGEYVVAAWSDGYVSTAAGQGYVYLSYGIEGSGGWPRMRIYPATASMSNLAKQPAIAFDPRPAQSRTAHLAWSQHTGSGQTFNKIYYASCNLANPSTCSSVSPATVRQVSNNAFMPDIAVDKGGVPYVAWVEENSNGTSTHPWYAGRTSGTSWGAATRLVSDETYTATQVSIAYANVGTKGCLHMVWAGNNNPANPGFDHIGYKRIDLGGSDCGGTSPVIKFDQSGSHSNPKNPRVAASGNTVYVAWDIAAGYMVEDYPAYHLVYNFSSNNGGTWARQDGVNPEYLDFPSGTTTFTPHPSKDESQAGRAQYGSRLRPDVTLEITGTKIVPHLVWNEIITRSGEFEYHFDIFHTVKASSGWAARTNVTNGTKDFFRHSAAPHVRVGKNGHVHVTYLEETPGSAGIWLWDQVLYQGPIAKQAGVYLPRIVKSSN